MTDRPTPANTLDHSSWGRHQYHRMILPGGVVAFALPLWLHQQRPFLEPFDLQSMPVMLMAYLLLTILSWLPVPLRWLEGAIVIQLNSFVLWRVATVLFTPELDGRLSQLAATLPWVIVALLITSWVVSERVSLTVNSVMGGALALITITWWPAPPWTAGQAQLMNALLQLLMAATTVIVAQTVVLRRHHLISSRARQALQDAHTDVLTGLPNRRALLHTLEEHAHDQGGNLLAVGLLDVDHFKRINDQHGHATGDEVLRRLAVHLRGQQHAQPGSVVGRYGGEEFLLILRVPDASSAHDTCERLRRRLANEPLHGLNVTVSVGLVVSAVPAHIPTLLDAADEALYHAKNTGRNRVHRADLEPGELAAT
ncbi:diguanylate cyclase [Deinococcus sp. JMULE3]|uniref:GGDEF domain-containing protein n=1 Tax=Deinococcus sp. JMULE3 TaxID=2518341 RepID=UPI0015771678|nr:GGDEF domain-containing protein [Deinococcus sp. JMULE3]NTY00173.1 GGDEF domain-containing protein [Deinococcus sp. JMULE3]